MQTVLELYRYTRMTSVHEKGGIWHAPAAAGWPKENFWEFDAVDLLGIT